MVFVLSADCSQCAPSYTQNHLICDNNCDSNFCDGDYNTQQKVQKTVGVSSSEYAMNLSNVITSDDRIYANSLTTSQASDRSVPHNISSSMSVPRRRTRIRPGGLQPVATQAVYGRAPGGVDVKHNHYERYLARKKQHVLRSQPVSTKAPLPHIGNKTFKFSIVRNMKCDK